MTEIESIKNGQRLYHIIQAGERIFRSIDGITKDDFYAPKISEANRRVDSAKPNPAGICRGEAEPA